MTDAPPPITIPLSEGMGDCCRPLRCLSVMGSRRGGRERGRESRGRAEEAGPPGRRHPPVITGHNGEPGGGGGAEDMGPISGWSSRGEGDGENQFAAERRGASC